MLLVHSIYLHLLATYKCIHKTSRYSILFLKQGTTIKLVHIIIYNTYVFQSLLLVFKYSANVVKEHYLDNHTHEQTAKINNTFSNEPTVNSMCYQS